MVNKRRSRVPRQPMQTCSNTRKQTIVCSNWDRYGRPNIAHGRGFVQWQLRHVAVVGTPSDRRPTKTGRRRVPISFWIDYSSNVMFVGGLIFRCLGSSESVHTGTPHLRRELVFIQVYNAMLFNYFSNA